MCEQRSRPTILPSSFFLFFFRLFSLYLFAEERGWVETLGFSLEISLPSIVPRLFYLRICLTFLRIGHQESYEIYTCHPSSKNLCRRISRLFIILYRKKYFNYIATFIINFIQIKRMYRSFSLFGILIDLPKKVEMIEFSFNPRPARNWINHEFSPFLSTGSFELHFKLPFRLNSAAKLAV